MLDFMGYEELGQQIFSAVEDTLVEGIKTGDLGGNATTVEVTDAVIRNLRRRG